MGQFETKNYVFYVTEYTIFRLLSLGSNYYYLLSQASVARVFLLK